MTILNEQQHKRALELLREYQQAPAAQNGMTPIQIETKSDMRRVQVIEESLRPLIQSYLAGETPLSEFKSLIDSSSKRHPLWGFKGIKGQMFFNMTVNAADDLDECDEELKSAVAVPDNEVIASSRIKTFSSFIRRLGGQCMEAGKSGYMTPKLSSVPFFLSFFWQIQDRFTWPVYYTNSVTVMTDANIWQPSGDLADDYLGFKGVHDELVKLFSDSSTESFDLYKVEHIFWYKGNRPVMDDNSNVEPGKLSQIEGDGVLLPESYLPPIIAVLPKIAQHDESLVEAAKKSGTTLDRAFEKFIEAAFTIMGYDSKLLGQGKGRVPDGVAFARDDNYAVLWDAKIRANGYSIGTDDRVIREYITTQSRELKRRKALRNLYYAIISSNFADDFDDVIRSIKMETDINEVCLIESEALVAMVDARIRSPLQISLGPDGIQRLFTVSGILKASMVQEQLL
jgi:hypothetical protein